MTRPALLFPAKSLQADEVPCGRVEHPVVSLVLWVAIAAAMGVLWVLS